MEAEPETGAGAHSAFARETNWPVLLLLTAFLALPQLLVMLFVSLDGEERGNARFFITLGLQAALVLRLVAAHRAREQSMAWVGYLCFAFLIPVIAFQTVDFMDWIFDRYL